MTSKPTDFTCLHRDNLAYLESVCRDAGAITEQVCRYQAGSSPDSAAPLSGGADSAAWFVSTAHKQAQVSKLIMAYRALGHLLADVDPIAMMRRGDAREVELSEYDLSEQDMDVEFDVSDMVGDGHKSLRQILAYLHAVYCGPIGYEIRYLTSLELRLWLRKKVETVPVRPQLSAPERIGILQKLTAAEGIEKYLHRKYSGQKRFSLEGGDVLIPVLSDLIQQFGQRGVKEIVIGMAHRGRLNVLVNVLGKAPKDLFGEFEGKYSTQDADTETGDVKYHQGVSSDIRTAGGDVHVALSFNPSHLEIINPVVEGSVRARQERREDSARNQVVPILIHGDAAFAGQGVVMETLQMALTRGYSTGGTIHIIINNQIGFTTNTLDARSTLYCTEVAKMVQAPIFHVNGDDPDAVIFVARLALAYRMQFGGDVVLDIVCYRRHGHNEADEPSVTQPMMYRTIRNQVPVRAQYKQRLVSEGIITEAQADELVSQYRDQLDQGHIVAGQVVDPDRTRKMMDWGPYLSCDWQQPVKTGIEQAALIELAEQITRVPDGFVVHRQVEKVLHNRMAMVRGETPMDWGCAELLAYASLLRDNYRVRLSGQDAGRGTFSHRHATLHSQAEAATHIPLQYITARPSDFLVINSLLSEEAVLGFEYGYATTDPRTLVIWEGQFGDFVNGAQVVIDQFISSGQAKWSRVCGLTLFLPHGMEGQGPEHSSARLERFLQLCAEHNMQVCVPTTPAQMFHMLRRQMLRSFRRPLIVMTPKSLLRHKHSTSSPADLIEGQFHSVIGEIDALEPAEVKRVVMCTGKIYFDLLEERRRRDCRAVAIIRIEQLHPFPKADLRAQVAVYAGARQVVWCQEEPKNQGSWYQIRYYLRQALAADQSLSYAGREGSPSPAVGYYKLHVQQQNKLIDDALSIGTDDPETPAEQPE